MKKLLLISIIAIIGVLALFFFVTMNVKIAEINKDVSYQNNTTNENTRKIDKLSDDIITIREQILILDGKFGSLNDRFAMFIEIFRNNSRDQ